MEEIKVGEYVRTKNGCICQILRTTYSKYLSRNKEFCYEVNRPINVNMELFDEDITKHSPNIIDLIEVGDILEILCNEISKETNTIRIKDIEQLKVIKQIPKFIKSVTTKEQFASVSYEV